MLESCHLHPGVFSSTGSGCLGWLSRACSSAHITKTKAVLVWWGELEVWLELVALVKCLHGYRTRPPSLSL